MAKTLEGWQRLQRRLKAIPVAVRLETQKAVVQAAEDVADTQRALAPIDDGDLLESITVTPGGQRTPPHSQPGGATIVPENAALVTAGNSNVRYAHLVEFGTAPHLIVPKNAKALGRDGQFGERVDHPGATGRPFFFPGYRMSRKKAARKIKAAMSRAIRKTKNGH
jgi:hypothetical protein